jgi:hypothetical protein
MLKIERFQVKTYQEFIALKNEEPFKTYRTVSKSINFLMLFGGAAMIFVKKFLETAWTEEQCEKYIEENKLQDIQDQMFDRYKKETTRMHKYLACATDIRNKFFKLYSSLLDWHSREVEFATNNGYVRSPYGAVRRLPELLLQGPDDRKLNSRIIRNLQNIAVNSTIQNFESCLVMLGIIELSKWLKTNFMKSKIFNSVHDSIDLMIHRSEVLEVMSKAKEILEKDRPEYKGFPIRVDGEISDLSKGQIYKHGISFEKFKEEYEAENIH